MNGTHVLPEPKPTPDLWSAIHQSESAAHEPEQDRQPTLDREARVLLGWLDEKQARLMLAGARADRTLTEEQEAQIARAREVVASRQIQEDQDGLIRSIPEILNGYVTELRQSPSAQPYFSEGWRVALVDLPRVYGFQPSVFVDHAIERVSEVDPENLRSIAR